MDYQTFEPHKDLSAFVKCYWVLKIPKQSHPQRQRIVPDGCIEMIFTPGEPVKRYLPDDSYILQPRAMVLGQITEPLYIEPIGRVDVFSVRFYPGGFMPFVTLPLTDMENRDVELEELFGKDGVSLEHNVLGAGTTSERIQHVETFLLDKLKDAKTIHHIVKSTVDAILSSGGRLSVEQVSKEVVASRRQLERRFSSAVGLSPKQLAKIIRLQTALKMLLNGEATSLTDLSYENGYYDQAHFIKDFKEFTGLSPKAFYSADNLKLSSIFYAED